METPRLTARQRQIVGMFCSGWTYRQVASHLGLSPGTIYPSLKQSAKKMNSAGFSRAALLEAAESTQNFERYALPS